MLPLLSYKSKLLTPKAKAWQHLLSERCHPLQGDKHGNKPSIGNMAVHNHVYRSNPTWCLPWNNVLVMRKGSYPVVCVVCLKRLSACKAVLSEAVGFACDLTRRRRTPGHSPGVRRMGRTVCKTVPCYILRLIRGTAFQAAIQHWYTEGFALGYDRFA